MLSPAVALRILTTLLASSIASCAGSASVAPDAVHPPSVVEWDVEGLEGPAVIRVDEWGVPHIEASTHYDAFYVQGFNAARDRLWQIDMWRRRGLGRLSEVLGDAYVDQDRAARLFLYRGSMFREWLAYGSDAKRITESFVAGVNAWIALTERQPDLVAPEFALLGYAPEPWQAEDVVRIRSHGLWRNLASEVERARLLCHMPVERVALFKPVEPEWTPVRPDGFDVCSLAPAEVLLRDYRLAKAPVNFAAAVARIKGTGASASFGPSLDEAALEGVGSNNWAVAPSRTATGRPILADDPHRRHAVPSLRYVVHLKAPGLDVIGAGEPALPGISIGHNQRIGFGLTIFGIDQEDLYAYETHPDDPMRYRYGEGWERVRTVREVVSVKGGGAREVELHFTRHGPVLYADPEAKRLYAARVAWLEPGMAPYFGSIEYMRADNWREFVAALNRWGAPAENQVYADVDGHIGYKPAGLMPRRENWDGLLPVPGDGRYEWKDFVSMDALPEVFDPAEGWVATANQLTLPPDYPIDRYRVGFEWSAPWRYRRIEQVLSDMSLHTIDDSIALQRDYGSPLGAILLAAVARQADRLSAHASRAYALMRATADRSDKAGFRLEIDDPGAAVYGVWFFRHLRPELARLLAPPSFDTPAALDSRGVAAVVGTPDAHGIDRAAVETLIDETLAAAWKEAEEQLGADPTRWRWGDLHQARFRHPLIDLAGTELAQAMRFPPVPRGGDSFTPNNTALWAPSFDVLGGASFRMVLDVGNWDAARMTTAPAQSGVPGSKHYGDLLDVWANAKGEEGSVPLLYSAEAIRARTRLEIRLQPAD